MYAYIVKHNYVLGGMLFTICKVQLHVSAVNVGHLQVVQLKLINQIYMRDLAFTPLPCTLYTPIQMHVYLIDKFSLYNLKMANIYGRNM